MTLHKEKKQLRELIRQKKGLVSASNLSSYSHQLFNKLESSPHFKRAHTILCYYSLPDEVLTHDFAECWKDRKQILLPVIKGSELELRRYTGTANLQISEPFHIAEPTGTLFTDYANIDLALVPGMAFDRQGNRLGRGKGYYDRLLPQLSHAYKIGICFGFQVCEQIPCDSFDQPMDAVLTEQGWIIEKQYS